jgi:hypothetical protein
MCNGQRILLTVQNVYVTIQIRVVILDIIPSLHTAALEIYHKRNLHGVYHFNLIH